MSRETGLSKQTVIGRMGMDFDFWKAGSQSHPKMPGLRVLAGTVAVSATNRKATGVCFLVPGFYKEGFVIRKTLITFASAFVPNIHSTLTN